MISDPVSANQMLGTLSSDNPLRQEDSDKCEGEITEKEVFETMRNLPREKAMGPDGIPNEFYKTFARLITPELTRVYNEAHNNGRLSKIDQKGTISRLYKKSSGMTFGITDRSPC